MTPVTRSLAAPLELLAPAGDLTCLRAAIENGADAVYFGLDRGFNARARAENLSLDTLPEIIAQLHERRVLGYVTLNTLVFSEELVEFERIVRTVAESGADAVLIQDLGAARLVRAICPDLPIHASTQMTLTSAECIAAVESLGIARVVLPRELSLDEIADITRQTTVPVEVFAHGALCVAYSGQCLTSESLGGRSANRGQCAQACRLPYDLYCDGDRVDLERVKYLLSPQDLAAIDLVPALLRAGVCSLKIEGRLKTPEYVASATRHYRAAIDAAVAATPWQLTEAEREELELTFSRGFSPGWLEGCDHKRLVPGVSSAKRGRLIGTVRRVRGQRVEVELAGRLQPGDGVMFDTGQVQNEQPGGRVCEIFAANGQRVEEASAGRCELTFRREAVDLGQLVAGQDVWKSDSPAISRRLRRSFTAADPQQHLPLDLLVTAHVGQPLKIRATLGDTLSSEVQADQDLVAAQRHPVTHAQMLDQLSRLGNTAFRLRHLQMDTHGQPMVPLSLLGPLRRKLVEQLTEQLRQRPLRRVRAVSVLAELRWPSPPVLAIAPTLRVLVRSLPQLELVLGLGERQLVADFADIREYRTASDLAAAQQAELWLATPRIHKPGESGVFQAMLRPESAGILARNLASLQYFRQQRRRVIADYSLNVANELSARFIWEQGVERLTPSYDLNRDQLLKLVGAAPVEWLEVVIHQHMPMFHMEHCVFCAVLSPGTNKTNCGRPCDRHVVHLEDRVGMRHQLTADVGCRNTLFNAQPQSAAEIVPGLLARGVHAFRIELLEESQPERVARMIRLYRQLLAGEVRGDEVLSQLQAVNRVGVTRGTLEPRRDPLAIL